jgi:GNAT superfamily N-acetyltransferase
MTHSLRVATAEDLPELYDLLIAMHSGTIAGTSPIAPEILTAAIEDALAWGVVFLAELDGKIIGSIGGIETSDWWSDEIYLADRWFFVYKDHRSSRAALMLVKSFLEVGRLAGMSVKLGHVYSGDIDRKDNFYERLGLTKAGSLYTGVSRHDG